MLGDLAEALSWAFPLLASTAAILATLAAIIIHDRRQLARCKPASAKPARKGYPNA